MKIAGELETELINEGRNQAEQLWINAFLSGLALLAKHLGTERAIYIHVRSGLLIKSYAEASEEKPS